MAGKIASVEEVEVSKPVEAQKPPSSVDGHAFGALVYIFGILIAAIIFIVKKDDPYVKYHAAQAIVFDIAVIIVSFIISILAIFVVFIFMFLGLFSPAIFLLGFASFWVVWIAIMVFSLALLLLRLFFAWKAYQGTKFRLPILSGFVDKMVAN